MKAIYEVKFMDRRVPTTLMDTRRVAREATNKGFKQVMEWAQSVCADEEFIGSINIVACEML